MINNYDYFGLIWSKGGYKKNCLKDIGDIISPILILDATLILS